MAEESAATTSPNRKVIGRGISLVAIIGAVLVTIIAIWAYGYRPQTDDATLRANFIGVAPQVSGHIIDLRVKDNQFVREGDLLFAIDPRPYEHAVARAKAELSLTKKEVDAFRKAL